MLTTAFSRLRRHSRRAVDFGSGFQALYEKTPLGLVTLSPDGRFLSANAAMQRLLGYTEGELRRMHFPDVAHPDYAGACRANFARIVSGETDHFSMEKCCVRKDGGLVWERVIVSAVKEGGELRGVVGVTIDVTEGKRAEADYRALYTRTPVMMHSIDSEGRLLSVSDRWLEVMGYAPEEVLGHRSIEFLTEESRKRALETVLPEFYRTGSCTDVPYRFVKKDGGIIDVLLSATSERDTAGKVIRSLAVLVDVTERNVAEAKVRKLTTELEERVAQRTALLTAQQETSPDGILVVDPSGRIISYNKRFVEMWGVPPEVVASGSDDEAVRSVLDKLVDPDGFVKRIAELYAQKDARSSDEIALRDGRTFERYSSPITGAQGRYYGRIWYFHDITSRVERERLLRKKTGELERSNADLEVYAYAASHDLTSPLRKIAVFATLLERRAAARLDAEERGMLARMRGAAEGLAVFVKELLALSLVGRELHAPETVDLQSVAAEVVSNFERQLKRIDAQVQVGELPVLRAHRSLLHHLLQNLLANALKFRRSDVPLRVTLQCRPGLGGVEIVMRDNGIGFEPRFAEKIFEPFCRLHAPSSYEGHGIGLAVCRRVATRYGGRIAAQSAPGLGSTFIVWLPDSVVAPPGALGR